MTDEEKKAYEFYRECNKNDLSAFEYFSEPSKEQIKYLETILNLIERLQKKNERLIERNIKYDETLEKLQKETIWKFKIQNKIEELEKNKNKLDEINKTTRLYSPYDTYDFQINILKELLGDE